MQARNFVHRLPSECARLGLVVVAAALLSAIPTRLLHAQGGPVLAAELDKGDPIPGYTGTFQAFSAPGMDDDGRLAFQGTGFNAVGGIYTSDAGAVTAVATFNTNIPNSTGQTAGIGNFALFQEQVLIHGGAVAFKGYDSTFSTGRLYSNIGGQLRLIAGPETNVPNASGSATSSTFTGVGAAGMSASGVLFRGFGNGGERGLYLWSPSSFRMLLDLNTRLPGTANTFAGYNLAVIDGNSVIAQGTTGAAIGIVVKDGAGSLRKVADTNTAIPGGSGNFTNMWFIDLEDGEAAFRGQGSNGQIGVYAESNGSLIKVADTSTSAPDGTGTFTNFDDVLIAGDFVVFIATRGTGTNGIFAYNKTSGLLHKIIATGDVLDGRSPTFFGFHPEGSGNGSFALSVVFSDNWRAVYRVQPYVIANLGPISDAGLHRAVAIGETVGLNGGASSDDQTPTSLLGFEWTIVSTPDGSHAVLADAQTVTPSFVPDVPGEYRVELTVTDQHAFASAPDAVSIVADIEPAFVLTTLSSGNSLWENDNRYYRSSSNYFYPQGFEGGLIRGSRYLYTYDYDYLTGVWSNAYDYSLRTLDETAETRIAGTGDAIDDTDRVIASTGQATVADDGSVLFDASTQSPTLGWQYGLFEHRNGEITEILTPPVHVIGQTASLNWISRLWNTGLLVGSHGSCDYVTRNGYTYCYYHYGLYRRAGAEVDRIVDTTMMVPGTTERFVSFGEADEDAAGNVLFTGYWYEGDESNWTWHYGIFVASSDGNLQMIVDSDTSNEFAKGYVHSPKLVDGGVMFGGCRWTTNFGWECGIYSVIDGLLGVEVSDRNVPLDMQPAEVGEQGAIKKATKSYASAYLDTWNFDTDGAALGFYAAAYDSNGTWNEGTFWKEGGRVTKVAGSGTQVGTREYDWVWPGCCGGFIDRRTLVLAGEEQIDNTWSYDEGTGQYFYRYESVIDTLLARFDSDRDAVGDDVDNCPLRPNAEQLDADFNGIGNVCEDTDLDLVLDSDDNCPIIANVDQGDADSDLVGNSCDVCPIVTDRDQTDSDGDGVGDACDNDSDGDGYADDVDNCLVIVNDQSDIDIDGSGDVCDADADGDGIDNVIDGRMDGMLFVDESALISTRFTDQVLGGRSFGQIIGNGQIELHISDSPKSEGGVLVAAPSGSGRAKIKQCGFTGKDAFVEIDQGSIVEVTCGSIAVQPFVNRALLTLDDDVVIDVPQNSTARVVDSGTDAFLVRNEAGSVFPLEMTLGATVKVTVAADSAGQISSPADGQYLVKNLSSSAQPLVIEKDGIVQSIGPGAEFTTQYEFSGFFAPIDNPPVLNTVRAGAAVPVKFSLSGDRGLSILAPGFPTSQSITCDLGAVSSNVEEVASAGNTTLSYDPLLDQYVYVWKTAKAWTGCRQLTVRLNDGQEFNALFKFSK